MVNSILQYPFITPYDYAVGVVRSGESLDSAIYSPVFQWLLNGKIAENPVVTPNSTVQIVRPSAKNRFLESVKVEAITTTTPTTPTGE